MDFGQLQALTSSLQSAVQTRPRTIKVLLSLNQHPTGIGPCCAMCGADARSRPLTVNLVRRNCIVSGRLEPGQTYYEYDSIHIRRYSAMTLEDCSNNAGATSLAGEVLSVHSVESYSI